MDTSDSTIKVRRLPHAFLIPAAVAILVVIGFALRIYNVANQSIWADEIYTMLYAKMSFVEMLRFHTSSFDPHAPLLYVIMKLWVQIAGDNELSFRFPTIFFGVLLIPTIFVMGRMLAGSVLGLLATLLLVANPFHVWYAQEARTYTLAVLLTTVSTILFLKILTKQTSAWIWAAYVVFTTLSVYSHYFSLFMIAFHNLIFLFFWQRRRLSLRNWLLSQSCLVVPYLPWIGFATSLIARHSAHIGTRPMWEILPTLATNFNFGWFLPFDHVYWVPILIGALVLAAFVRIALSESGGGEKPGTLSLRETITVLVVGLILPIVGTYLFFLVTGRYFIQERYLIISTPSLYMLMSLGLLHMGRLSRALPIALILVIVGLQTVALANIYTSVKFVKPDHRSLARLIEDNERNGDVIVGMGDVLTTVFDHYYDGKLTIYNIRESFPLEGIPGILQGLAANHPRIWLLPYWDRPMDLVAERWLNHNAFKMENGWLKSVRYTLYSTESQTPWLTRELGAQFENEVELGSYSVASAPLKGGEPVLLRLHWKPLENGSRDLKVTVRLKDAQNHVVSQIDRPPQDDGIVTSIWRKGETITDSYGIMIPYGSPPGQYSLEVGLYDKKTGQPLLVSTATESRRPIATLGNVEVVSPGRPANTSALHFNQRADVDYGSIIRLLGYDRLRASAGTGERLSLSAYWQMLDTTDRDLEATVRFVRSEGDPGTEVRVGLGPPAFGTSLWGAGDTMRTFLDVMVPNKLQSGNYKLVLAVTDGQSELGATPPAAVVLGEVAVKARQRSFENPVIQHKLSTQFGEIAELLGYDVESASNGEGSTIKLALYWKSRQETGTNYSVFTHMVDGNGKIMAQHDSAPAAGSSPTPSWLKGEVIKDLHDIRVGRDVPPGDYWIVAGLYDPATATRLLTADKQDLVTLQPVRIGN